MGRRKDLSDFGKGQIVTARRSEQVLWGFPDVQWLVATKSEAKKDNQWTGVGMLDTQSSLVKFIPL